MTLWRNTARGGRRRWLARPTWRALALAAIVVGVWLANGWWYLEAANDGTLEVRCEQGLLDVFYNSGGIVQECTCCTVRRRSFRLYHDSTYGIVLSCRPELSTFDGPFSFKLDLPLINVVAPLVGAILLWSMSRRQPFPAGHCAFCGYDLRGATDSRCPECGTAVSAPPPYSETR